MLNFSQTRFDQILLDPFCGSGTILQEALLMGFTHVIGSDISPRAIVNTKKNLAWLTSISSEKKLMAKPRLFHYDARQLDKVLKLKVGAIVTEPHLGPALNGRESDSRLRYIIGELSPLYRAAFQTFRKLLKSDGRIVIVFPIFRRAGRELELPILPDIKKIGFQPINSEKLIYGRPDQKIWRQIFIFQFTRG